MRLCLQSRSGLRFFNSEWLGDEGFKLFFLLFASMLMLQKTQLVWPMTSRLLTSFNLNCPNFPN